ncbi:MAG: hypothetical protein ACI8Q9_000056 [Planctomycetota bacterium]|jgi:uncharacterized protein (TIGR02722 family)
MKKALQILFALPLFLAAGCSSVGYDDPDGVETLTIDFGSTDLQTMAADMSDSLLASPNLAYLEHSGKGTDKRIIMYVGDIENRTTEHIDTAGISDSIRVRLMKAGKFRFVAGDAGQTEIGDQVSFQQGSGRVDGDMAKAFGKQLGADVVVYGTLRSIDKEKGRSLESLGNKKEDVFYQFVLTAVNIETSEFLWSEESTIRKRSTTGIFGR